LLSILAAIGQKDHMQLHGKNIIGNRSAAAGATSFTPINAATGEELSPHFYEATEPEINQALTSAEAAFEGYRAQPPDKTAAFLDRIAEEILRLGDELIRRANLETALPEQRLTGERARTVNQLKMFADLVRDGSWLEACIDRAQPQRQPLPKPDLRRMLVPIGPVVVFGASNFPLAFSVAGGDTASALAAGNSVVVKAHPAHPGTSEMAARAIQTAAAATRMPPGVFSMLHGKSYEIGLQLVRHPAVKSVGFTGSLQGGRALFNAAGARPEPIPVYAEMGSTNPIFVLPGALQQRAAAIAQGFLQSVTLGVGQFCTNPGLLFTLRGAGYDALIETVGKLAAASSPGAMLYPAICHRFHEGIARAEKVPGVAVIGRSEAKVPPGHAPALALAVDGAAFQANELLLEEIFGPSTILVTCTSRQELEKIARSLPGQLTATVHGTEDDLAHHPDLLSILQQKAGRLLFNGFPTGVEVCPSMHHGGPYPATTHPHFTSVGTAAIKRFTRPVCFQGFPEAALPVELRNQNSRKIWRLVDGQLTKEDA
jgi:NADP-dependent aldehyde dehydrogenase